MINCPKCGGNQVQNHGHAEYTCLDCNYMFIPTNEHDEYNYPVKSITRPPNKKYVPVGESRG